MSGSFEEWLVAAHYRPSTVAVSLQQLSRLRMAHEGQEPLPAYCSDAARRVLAWLQSEPQENYDDGLRTYLLEQGVQPVTNILREKPAQRLREARSFDPSDWDRFRDAIYMSDDPRDRVIDILCTTGIRIGDALRIPTARIVRGLELGEMQIERKGGVFVTLPIGVPEPWIRLRDQLLQAQASTVGALISPRHPSPIAGRAAYRQVDRRLKWWQTELALPGRIHTHKMRRTFAIRLYDMTKDLLAVQQGLNNGPQATMKYLDESRTGTIAGFQRDLQRRGTK